jgi:hypothetical protein
VPAINQSRLHPWQELVANDPSLVAITYPAAYLHEIDSPYNKGSGPGKLGSWVERFANQTSLQLSRSDRVVFSSNGSPDKFLLVSEGDYLTPAYGNALAKNTNLTVQKSPPKLPPSIKVYQAPNLRQTALIPLTSGSQVYAVTSAPQLLSSFANRLPPLEKVPQPSRIDNGILAAVNAANSSTPPLIMAALGQSFQSPLSFQSADKETPTLQDLGIELITAQIHIHERMQIEIAILGKNEKSVRDFQSWVKKKTSEAYPKDGPVILNLLSRLEQSSETVNGKYRLTLKGMWTPDQWSSFLDKVFAN